MAAAWLIVQKIYIITVVFRASSGLIPTHFRLDTGSFWKILRRTYDQYRLEFVRLPQWNGLQARSDEVATLEALNDLGTSFRFYPPTMQTRLENVFLCI